MILPFFHSNQKRPPYRGPRIWMRTTSQLVDEDSVGILAALRLQCRVKREVWNRKLSFFQFAVLVLLYLVKDGLRDIQHLLRDHGADVGK
jgi:hypothetical protein